MVVRSPLYWRASENRLQKLVFLPIEDQNTFLNKFLNGDCSRRPVTIHATRLMRLPVGGGYMVRESMGQRRRRNRSARRAFSRPTIRAKSNQ